MLFHVSEGGLHRCGHVFICFELQTYNDAACVCTTFEAHVVEFGLHIPVPAEMSDLLPHKETSTLVTPVPLVRDWRASGRAFWASPSPPLRRPTTDPSH
jgi:hypothetical protein